MWRVLFGQAERLQPIQPDLSYTLMTELRGNGEDAAESEWYG